jgi:hypothetical protein
VALRLIDGSPAWTTPAVFNSAPSSGLSLGWVTTGGFLQPAVFLATGNFVAAANAYTGATLWLRAMPEVMLPGPPVVSNAGAQRSVLYVAGSSGRVFALDSDTGASVTGGLTVPAGTIVGTLALAGPYLYVPTSTGLVAADAATGGTLWTSPLPAASGVAVAGGVPYVGTADGRLVGYGGGIVPPGPQPPTPGAHDLAIDRIDMPALVSRSQNAEVYVILTNKGATAESYHIFFSVVPGSPVNDYIDTVGPGETKTIGVIWPTYLMGPNGTKSFVARVIIRGQNDSNPADNVFAQPVTVGP